MKLKYTGTADFQEFSAADFKKAGVDDARKVRFARGEATEVDDAVGEALVSKEGVFGDFKFEAVEDDEEESEPQAQGSADDSEMTESGRASTTDTDTAGGTTRRGRARGGTTRA